MTDKIEKVIGSEVEKEYRKNANYLFILTIVYSIVVFSLIAAWVFIVPNFGNFMAIVGLLFAISLVTIVFISFSEKQRDIYVNKLTEFYNTTMLQYMKAKQDDNARDAKDKKI